MGYSKGRKLTEKVVREISNKYNSHSDWYTNDPASYRAAKRLGIFEELKNSKNIKRESIPQGITKYIFDKIFSEDGIYNCRTVMPPYEIDVYYPNKKFGVEYDGYAFHFGRYRDEAREQRKFEKESTMTDIKIFHISEDRYYKISEYVLFIKKYIIDNLALINDWCDTSILSVDVENLSIPEVDVFSKFDWDDVITLIDSYKSGSEFRNNHRALYQKIIRRGKKDILDYISKKTVNYWSDKLKDENSSLIEEVLNKHVTYTCFYLDKELYLKCNYKKTIIPEIKERFLQREIKNPEPFIIQMLSKHVNYSSFYNDYKDHYYAKKRGLVDIVKERFYGRNK